MKLNLWRRICLVCVICALTVIGLPEPSYKSGRNEKVMDSLIFDKTITIVGSEEFVDHVRKALTLLQSKSPSGYPVVKKYIGRIIQGAASGMYAYYNPPTFQMSAKEAFSTKTIGTMHYSGVQVPLCMMLIIQKNTMTIKKFMDTLTAPILRSMYGRVKLLSASALRFKRKFVVRLGRIKRFTNIWKVVTADTVKYDETGRDEPWNRSSLARSSATLYQLQSPQPAQSVVETASIRFVLGTDSHFLCSPYIR
jgi:hypothetical protein